MTNMKLFFSFIFLVCFLIFFTDCNHKRFIRKFEDSESQLLQFDNNWDASTAAEVEIDDIFTEIADKNLEKVEASKGGKGSVGSQTCADCVPVPANFR